MSIKTAVIYDSVRQNRKGIRAAKFIVTKHKERGHEVTLVDPMEYDLPLPDKMYKEYKEKKLLKSCRGYMK